MFSFDLFSGSFSAHFDLKESDSNGGRRLLVLGGNGFVGREVCRLAVQRGFQVTSLSRRGENPEPGNQELDQVPWLEKVEISETSAEPVSRIISNMCRIVQIFEDYLMRF